MRRAILFALLLGACATSTPSDAFVHHEFTVRRPAMMALDAEGPGEFSDLMYSGLIALDYSVLAPGEPPGLTGGTARAKAFGDEASVRGTLVLFSPNGTRIYESRARARTVEDLAERLLAGLPRK